MRTVIRVLLIPPMTVALLVMAVCIIIGRLVPPVRMTK
jgi:hypothetical protein